jgi:fluoroquinolone resistance protein
MLKFYLGTVKNATGKTFVEDEKFEKIDFTEQPIRKGTYEHCTFINCNFSNTNLSEIEFAECTFKDCNLSTAKLDRTALKDVKFKDCKMLGLHFQNCSEFLFEVSVENCILNLSGFYKRNLKKTQFINSSLRETDFSEADLTGSLFDNCDLSLAIFDRTILEKADLRTAFNYSIDPENNRIKKAKFSVAGVTGLLHKYDIEID